MHEIISWNDDWEYVDVFSEEFLSKEHTEEGIEQVRIPHSNCCMPLHYFPEEMYQKICGYRKILKLKDEYKGKTILLHFEGVAHEATVYLNGQKIAVHQGGYTEFCVDLTPYVDFSKINLLAVKVDSTEKCNIPPFGNVIDYMTFGGIYREVNLVIKEKQYIKDLFVKPEDVLLTQKKLEISCEVTEFSNNLVLVATMQEKGGKEPKLLFIEELKESKVKYKVKVHDVKLWDMENPQLYEVTVSLLKKEGQTALDLALATKKNALDESTVTTGFREAKFTSDGFFLNGKKVLLRGLNRHQSYPYVGYAMPKAPQVLDADLLKYELGVNAVRTSHYPQSKHFLNRCDEIGLLVFTEIPGWQYIGNKEWKEIACKNVKEMVVQNRNHPSIILWGVRINESEDDDEFYQKTNQIAKLYDDSRQTGGVRYIKHSKLFEDVYTYNDFLYDGKTRGVEKKTKVTGTKNVPYLITEYNGHMFPTKSYDSEEHRIEHALRHAKVLDSIACEKGISGGFGWCMFDYNTHKDFGSGDRICYHGVMDSFRNPKLAAYIYASQAEVTDVFEVSSTMDIGEHPGCFRSDTYFITNADSIKVYKNSTFLREFNKSESSYHNLSHGPILMNDYIGNRLIKEEGYSVKKARCVKDGLNAVARFGISHIPLKSKGSILKAILFHGLKLKEAVPLYNKYIGDWGGHVTTYRFEAIKDGKVVKQITKEPVTALSFDICVDHTKLIEDATYDVATVRIRVIDQNKNQVPYYQEPVSFSTSGPIKLIGPSITALQGGMGGTYVKSIGKKGKATLTIHADGMKDFIIPFEIDEKETVQL